MLTYVRRWFLVEHDGIIEKREFECIPIPEQKGYLVKSGCIREFVNESKVYDTEQAADAKLKKILAETT
jgi:hypothetical protein